VFLTGGPGEPGTAVAPLIRQALAPLASDHDIVVPDQRGAGRSDPLRCASAPRGTFGRRSAASLSVLTRATAQCGDELGRLRGLFSTYETALDLEDLRRALGVERIIPFGVSYGGQVAGEYARRFPARTQAVVLDSTSPIEGLDALNRLPRLALPRVLREVCFPPRCADLFGDPQALLARAVRRLGTRGLTGRVVLPDGRRRTARVGAADLYALIGVSDVDPLVRAELPAATEAAARGDAAPLLRLLATPASTLGAQITRTINEVRYAATTCTEGRLPWAPDSDPASRPALLEAALTAEAEAYAPFPVEAILPQLPATLCLGWPATARPPWPPFPARAPDVPALVVAGREDLRTPLEDQRRAAAQFPRGQVLAVPGVGHAVTAADRSGCAVAGVRAFLTGQALPRCPNARAVEPALPIPARLTDLPVDEDVPPAVGRTTYAVVLTLLDASRRASGTTRRFAGLRGGRATIGRDGALTLSAYEHVPGVRVSGRLSRRGTGTVRVAGVVAGTLRVSRSGALRGTLGGERIRFTPTAPR